MRLSRITLVLALIANVLGATVVAHAEPVPEDATWEEVWFPSADGTMLHADVFLPKDRAADERHPVILAIGPYFGSGGFVPPTPTGTGPVLRFNDLIEEGRIFERGYAYIQVDSRGYGGSDGCYDLGGAGEQMDAVSAVEWAAEQDWSTGKVGMWGKSYDAWTQVMALAGKPKGLAAAIIQSPLIEAYRGFYMNGVHYDAGWYGTPGLYGGYDLIPPSAGDSPPDEFIYPAKGTATNPDCYAQNMSMTAVPDHSIPYWQERDIIAEAAKSTVPVLWSHGFLDINTKPDNFLPIYSKLRGPKRAWFGQYDHVRGNEARLVGRDGFMDEAMAWFEHYLKGGKLKRFPPVEVQDNEGFWRSEQQWPPADAKKYQLPLNAGVYVDERGTSASGPLEGTWTFSQPMPYDVHFAGAPRLSVDLTATIPAVNVIGLLYDVDPEGSARLITRGALWVRDAGATLDLYPEDWRLRKGHRLGLILAGSDESHFSPIPSNTEVTVSGGSLTLGFLRFLRKNNLEGFRAAAQGSVPVVQLNNATIEAGETKMKLPPRLKRR
ncbi:MAG TPA: CocE/NonD family hydrolase [Actinomycetota bacterium]|nr:CocE/NonD family hydrolase [Actinomycetota bacterium]